jgi:hypothetical protein
MTSYYSYLKTDHWRDVRQAALVRAGHKCQLCSATQLLEVHHNTYERLGCERPEDLVVLCDRCHTVFHVQRDKRTRRKILRRNPKTKKLRAKYRKPPKYIDNGPKQRFFVDQELLNRLIVGEAGMRRSIVEMFGMSWPLEKGWRHRMVNVYIEVSPERLQKEIDESDRRMRCQPKSPRSIST